MPGPRTDAEVHSFQLIRFQRESCVKLTGQPTRRVRQYKSTVLLNFLPVSPLVSHQKGNHMISKVHIVVKSVLLRAPFVVLVCCCNSNSSRSNDHFLGNESTDVVFFGGVCGRFGL
jgi:hypothetical protein